MDVKIIRSNRKTVAIQVNSDLSITVRAPHFASEKDIEEILMKKEAWISKHIEEIKTRKKRFESESTDKFTPEKRWGSCSSKGNLNFNCLLMLAPSEILDYVVVHELCHRKQMNHSKAFWLEVEKVLPDYKESIEWLKEEGCQLMYLVTGR